MGRRVVPGGASIGERVASLWTQEHVKFAVGNGEFHLSCTYMVKCKFPRLAESYS